MIQVYGEGCFDDINNLHDMIMLDLVEYEMDSDGQLIEDMNWRLILRAF